MNSYSMEGQPKLVLDAGVLIGLVNTKDKHHTWALGIMNQTLVHALCMGVVNYAECLVAPAAAGKLDLFKERTAGLGIQVIHLLASEAFGLAEVRAVNALKMPDSAALHLAVTLEAELATTDIKLAQAARQLGLRVFAPGNEA